MSSKKRPARSDTSRLKILAAGDEQPFAAAVSELLASGDRLAREAALDALLERPLPALREALLAVYREVDAEGEKRDPGAHIRTRIVRLVLGVADVRDVAIGMRASDTYEKSMGVDGTANLRAFGLRLLAATGPDLFPYVAVEHIDDSSEFTPEPANTAIQLLAGTGNQLAVYQWLVAGGPHEPDLIGAAVELLTDAPPAVMSLLLARLTRDALARADEPLLTKLAETIVERELNGAYTGLASILDAKVSNELHSYVALLLAATNRPALLAILEQQIERTPLRRGAILDALRVRTTPEQAAILKRWAGETND